ncbi:MAG: YkgJ family cysteine cluster protein [Methanobacteriota archaeon]
MLPKKTILDRLQQIYAQIPDCECVHCHQCCGPIAWFKPEELLIRDFLNKQGMEYVVWTTEEFTQHNNRCPYLKQDRCSIYPVRPIVCRLQGIIPQLPCQQHGTMSISPQQHASIKQSMDALVRNSNGLGCIYGTRKLRRKKE